jgi:hypothetical protein
MESLPPQCGGPDLVGWDWAAVDGEESRSGTTWGDYSVTGTWDGHRLTLTEPAGPSAPADDTERTELTSPCDPPPEGWAAVDPATTTDAARSAAFDYANEQPDFAGGWLDNSINPAADDEPHDEAWSIAMNDPSKSVLNLRFTGDLGRHENEVRAIWGGPLCISVATRTAADLEAIRDEVMTEFQASGSMISAGLDDASGVVGITVWVVDADDQARLDDRYGAGVVVLAGFLKPVE